MTATEEPVLVEKRETIIAACEEKTASKPVAGVDTEKEAGTETETETDQQEIDFVTLGMFIIGRLSSRCCIHSRLLQLFGTAYVSDAYFLFF